jgi:rRNA maturation endonuclease Nob1
MSDEKKREAARAEQQERLTTLTAELAADGELSDTDLKLIADAAEAMAAAIVDARNLSAFWQEHAHVHKVAHRPKLTVTHPKDSDPLETVDVSGFVCHDCGRGLINDTGTEPLLICPQVAGWRPAGLVPEPAYAVECGLTD